jgi:hypothetical protein
LPIKRFDKPFKTGLAEGRIDLLLFH